MGGVECVIIIQGEGVQGDAARLATTADASCLLVDYLDHDESANFNPADAQPIADFHVKARKVLKDMNAELDAINQALAAKYNRPTG